jgi:hypothetical protein
MQISAECRWFWRGKSLASDLFLWFKDAKIHPCAAGGGEYRCDEYLHDTNQAELGIKRRGQQPGVEVKGLVRTLEKELESGSFRGPIEIWATWTSPVLDLRDLRMSRIEKFRWLRKFDTTGGKVIEIPLDSDEKPIGGQPLPDQGCNVEFTEITLDNTEAWRTLGFEAFGPLDSVETSLRLVSAELAKRNPPMPKESRLASYPAWLSSCV